MLEVKIFLDENDLLNNKPLYEYIMRYLMHNKIAGATIIEGVMGFGKRHHLNTPNKIGNLDDVPYMIIFIDNEENVNKVLPHIKEIIGDGTIVATKVEQI